MTIIFEMQCPWGGKRLCILYPQVFLTDASSHTVVNSLRVSSGLGAQGTVGQGQLDVLPVTLSQADPSSFLLGNVTQ